jgi:hypothetical protein
MAYSALAANETGQGDSVVRTRVEWFSRSLPGNRSAADRRPGRKPFRVPARTSQHSRSSSGAWAYHTAVQT